MAESQAERRKRFGTPEGECGAANHRWRSGGFEFVEYSDDPKPGTIVNDMLSICETCDARHWWRLRSVPTGSPDVDYQSRYVTEPSPRQFATDG